MLNSLSSPRKASIILLTIVAASLSIFQVFQGITADIGAAVFRPVHLTWVMVLIFLSTPLIKSEKKLPKYFGLSLDYLCAILTIICGYFISSFDYDDMSYMFNGLTATHFYAGLVLSILLLEATRRTVGIVMTFIALIFLAYAMFGNLLPSSVSTKGFSVHELVTSLVFSTDGIFGSPLAIASSVVFIYVLFGAFLQVTGAGQFFIDCAFAIAGKYRGGPAKASVLASAALGSISGSAIANTVTTGALTIPMMKKLGYKPEQAAGIEAAASTGGQIMPPVMGAGAFVMAQFTGIPYATILLVSIAPAILYFACTLLYVHLMACKLGIKGMTDTGKIKTILIAGWHFLFPLGLVMTLLLLSYSPVLVGVGGCISLLLVTMCRRSTWIGIPKFIEGLKEGALSIMPITVACATAGFIVGVVGKTGIGLQFAQFLLAMSGGHLFFTLVLVAIAAVILGMGLPVTAAYIVLSVMAAPALTGFGIDLLVAHLFIFWLSQTSNVTPPIALAAFAGAGIANASPMKSAIQALKLAQGFFIIPLMMIYSELIYTDKVNIGSFSVSVLATCAVIVCFASAIEGRLFDKNNLLMRGIYFLIAVGFLFDSSLSRLALLVIFGLVLLFSYKQSKKDELITA